MAHSEILLACSESLQRYTQVTAMASCTNGVETALEETSKVKRFLKVANNNKLHFKNDKM